MAFDPQKHWNESHLRHPKDREPSDYAKDRGKYFPRGSTICDLGGGDGIDSLYFISKGHKVYLFDISNLALERAKERVREKGYENRLFTESLDLTKDRLPTEDNFFDVLFARLSLHYFYQDRMVEIFKDIYRVLKEDGTAYIAVKSPDDKTEMKWLEDNNKKLGEGIYSENGLVKTRFTKEKYTSILKEAGITNFEMNDYTENFGGQRIFVKSKAKKLLYIEVIIRK